MKVPIREKYIDEIFKPLFLYGKAWNGFADVCNVEGSVINLPEDLARKVVEINEEYMQKLYDLLGMKD